jgi:lysophospholipase L1-like esterase
LSRKDAEHEGTCAVSRKRVQAADGLHPNKKGYAIMAPLALKAIDQALAGIEHGPR